MTGLDPLHGSSVDSGSILRIHNHNQTKFLTQEPTDLKTAIGKLRDFFAVTTPEWEKAPEYDELKRQTYHGKPKLFLYQFELENKRIFDENSFVIDMAMAVIPRVTMHLWEQLKLHRETGSPVNLPFMPPNGMPPQQPVPAKKTFLQKLSFGAIKPEIEKDPTDEAVKEWVAFANDVQYRWGNIKEWYYGSIKYPTNCGTWSDIKTRSGMEYMLARIAEFFDYYITTRFMMIFNYAMNLEIRNITEDVNKFTAAVARQQSEFEKANPGMSQV